MPEAAASQAHLRADGRKDALLAKIGDDQRHLPDPNQEGIAGIDSEEVWMITEESAILVISTSLLGTILFFLIKEAYF